MGDGKSFEGQEITVIIIVAFVVAVSKMAAVSRTTPS